MTIAWGRGGSRRTGSSASTAAAPSSMRSGPDGWRLIRVPVDGTRPEDWLGSATRSWTPAGHDPTDEGLSHVEIDGRDRTVEELLEEDPELVAGRALVERVGRPTVGVLVKLLDPAERLPVHAHPTRAFARQHLDSFFGKTEAWIHPRDAGDDRRARRRRSVSGSGVTSRPRSCARGSTRSVPRPCSTRCTRCRHAPATRGSSRPARRTPSVPACSSPRSRSPPTSRSWPKRGAFRSTAALLRWGSGGT